MKTSLPTECLRKWAGAWLGWWLGVDHAGHPTLLHGIMLRLALGNTKVVPIAFSQGEEQGINHLKMDCLLPLEAGVLQCLS